MSDPVLTNDEKDALLSGMSSGEIEVHSRKGPTYAVVQTFEVGPRSHITTDSYPRLQSLNKQFAARVSKLVEQLLNSESEVSFKHLRTLTFSEFCEQTDGLSMLIEFAPQPLQGSALINLDAVVVEMLVETFYGGNSDDSSRQLADIFTPGEISVAKLFANVVLSVMEDVWSPLDKFDFEIRGTHLNSGVIERVDGADDVIATEFTLAIDDKPHPFHILWPRKTVVSLLPVFDGQKRERDVTKDAHWQRALRSRVVDADVGVATGVGNTCLSLREVTKLVPGDIIPIANPRKGTLFAGDVAVLEGHFGVHDGRYAIEARRWIDVTAAHR